MQPRLIAISYPSSSTNDGREAPTGSKAKEHNHLSLHSKLSGRLRSLSDSWSDFRNHFRSQTREQPNPNKDATFDILNPWFETPISGAGYRSCSFKDRRITSNWQKLPQSIQADILKHLEHAYDHLSHSDVQQRWRNDLMAVQLCCTAWSSEAQKLLYKNIQLKPSHTRDWSTPPPKAGNIRISQLRQTLRSKPGIASLVKHLTLLPETQQHDAKGVSYSDLVASVVMTCPKLETLTTFYVLYTHSFNRLFHAVSTRTKLTQHTWVIGEDPLVQSRAGRRYKSGILSTQQTRLFLQHHAYWRSLETLNIVSHNGQGVLEHNLFVRALNMLPSLKHLHVSAFDANDFSNDTLLSIPPLVSLRLNHCSGVTETGLCQWAQSSAATRIHKLVLESQNITSLLTISDLLESLTALDVLRVVQLEFEPGLPLELEIEQPLFTSKSLKILEWYTASGQSPESLNFRDDSLSHNLYEKAQTWPRSKSSQLFLSSILDFGFPQLQKIILPGYDNLNGLLRWLRHSSWATQQYQTAPPSQRSSTPNSFSPTSFVSNRRNTMRLSLRPSSPNFDEYVHWCKSPPTCAPLPAVAELPERNNSFISPQAIVASAPITPALPAVPPSTTSSATSSPTHSNYRSSDQASIETSLSTPSPRHRTFEDSSNAIHLVKDEAIFMNRLDGDNGDKTTSTQHGDGQDRVNSRHSSISILLDQYTQTGPVTMRGALIEN